MKLLDYQRAALAPRKRLVAWLGSRRVGKTFSAALARSFRACGVEVNDDGAIASCELRRGVNQILISASERQTEALIDEVAQHLGALEMVLSQRLIAHRNSLEIELTNGRKVTGFPGGNASAVRSAGGDLLVDEVQSIPRLDDLLRSALPVAGPSLRNPDGFRVTLMGTAGPDTGPWHALMTGDDDVWQRIITTINDAVAAGFPANVDEIRASMPDEEAFNSEYQCQWFSAASRLVSASLYDACTVERVRTDLLGARYGGADVATSTTGDRAGIVTCQRDADGILWITSTWARRGNEWADLEQRIGESARGCARLFVDATGSGAMLADRLSRAIPSVRPFTFTSASKAEAMSALLLGFERRALRIAASEVELREAVLAIKREVTAAGNERFDISRSSGAGHGDLAVALALAVLASGGFAHGLGDDYHAGIASRAVAAGRRDELADTRPIYERERNPIAHFDGSLSWGPAGGVSKSLKGW